MNILQNSGWKHSLNEMQDRYARGNKLRNDPEISALLQTVEDQDRELTRVNVIKELAEAIASQKENIDRVVAKIDELRSYKGVSTQDAIDKIIQYLDDSHRPSGNSRR